MAGEIDHIPVAEFEADCSRLLDQVIQRRRQIVITRDGRPVAKLIPWMEEATDIFGRMAGTAKICGDIISPIDDLEWTGDEDNI